MLHAFGWLGIILGGSGLCVAIDEIWYRRKIGKQK